MKEKMQYISNNSFDARAELKKVRDIGNHDNLSKDEILKLGKKNLEDFTKKLADQMVGCAKINSELQGMALSSQELNMEEMKKYIAKHAHTHKLTPLQIRDYEYLIDKVAERNKIVNDYYKNNCERKSGEQVFEQIFNKKPDGEISIEKSPLSLVITCDEADFSYIFSFSRTETQIRENDSNDKKERAKESDTSNGFTIFFPENKNSKTAFAELGNTLIVVKRTGNEEKGEDKDEEDEDEDEKEGDKKKRILKGIITHEQNHVLNMLILGDEAKNIGQKMNDDLVKIQKKFTEISDEELQSMTFEQYARFFTKPAEIQIDALLKGSEVRAKEEILAAFRQGHNPWRIHKVLKNSEGGYTVIDENMRQQFSAALMENIPNVEGKKYFHDLFVEIFKQHEERYDRHLDRAIKVLSKLEEIGFEQDEIIGLLQGEPLSRWYKVFSRLKKSEKFQSAVILKNLKDSLAGYIDDIEGYSKKIKKIQEQLQNPSMESMLYQTWVHLRGGAEGDMELYRKVGLPSLLQENQTKLDETLKRKEEVARELANFEKQK